MFKIVFKQYSICVPRFVQKAFANPSSFYERKMPSFTNGSSKTPIQQAPSVEAVHIELFNLFGCFQSGTLCWRTFQSGTLCVFFKDAGATRSRIASWLEPAMQQRAGLAVFFSVEKLTLRKSRSCQRFRYETGGSYRQLFNIFWWKTPGLARGNFWCLWNGRFL